MSTLNARDGALCANTVGRAQEVAALLLQVAAIHLLVAVFNDDVFCCAVLSGRFSMASFVVWPFAFDSFLHCVDCGLCGSPSIALFSRHPPDFTSADVGDSNARPNVQGLARRRPHIFDTRKLESVGQSPVKREPFLASVPGSKSTTEERTFWPARVTRPTTMRPSVARCENFFGSPNVSTQNGKWR